jgi:Uma2 family endonuclease
MPSRYKFTPEQFHRMGELGLFDDGNRYELLEGEIYAMPQERSEHSVHKVYTARSLYRLPLSDSWHIRVGSPLLIGNSEPIPDVAIVAGSPNDYWEKHPTTALLIIEISKTTLEFDREKKLPLYARAGVPECWILNLQERVLEVYREPSGTRYKAVRYYTPDETIRPLFAPELEIPVASFLGQL